MKNEKSYYLGLDIGTDSVGYAATDEQYNLLQFHGEKAWGAMIFDAGQLQAERRSFRTARRRLDRRQQRVKLLQGIFAEEIARVDARFFIRLEESYKWREDVQDRYVFFNDKDYTDKEYFGEYPTIHHLICELMNKDEPHDVRLVYLACAWLVAHRGHFLSNIDMDQLGALRSVEETYGEFCSFFNDRGYRQPFEDVDTDQLGKCLKEKTGKKDKAAKLTKILLHGQKASKEIREEMPYSTSGILRLLAGESVNLKELFGKEEYENLELKSVSLGMDEEKYAVLMADIGEDYDLIDRLRALYDWAVLADTLGEYATISEAKTAVYTQHAEDLKTLKFFVRKYAPQKYNEVFREGRKDTYNYVAYSYHTDGLDEEERRNVKKKARADEFYKYVKGILKDTMPSEEDAAAFADMFARMDPDVGTFLPKQKNTDNRVIPRQLYQYELMKILNQAEKYLPFLTEKDVDGLSGKEKILSIFTYKLPYFVGPLNKNSAFSWMERRAEGKILPWNYERMIDFDASEDAFIRRMTNTCTYLDGETVLPKDSLCYQKFMVLNEINNLRINNERIPVELKQALYHELFEKKKKVRRKDIEEYLLSHQVIARGEENTVGGIDVEIRSCLSSHIAFRRLLDARKLSENDVERIIERASYAEDKSRVKRWLERNYPNLSDEDRNYIARIKIKDFGRLSRAFLTEIEGVADYGTGEITSIVGALWNTNYNLMELLSEKFNFREEVQKRRDAYYREHPATLEERLDGMYVSNSVRRSIYRTLDIAEDVCRAFGEPKKIFIEMTRGEDASRRGKHTTTRRQQIEEIYRKCRDEDVRDLKHELERLGERVDNRLQSDRLFLYFMQFGRCAYSNEAIDLDRLMSGSTDYNIEHIYPQAFVKDDSIINNKVLVLSKINGAKQNQYPVPAGIREKMTGVWAHWHKTGTVSEEKYKRLTRRTPFSDEERYGFISRQLTETSQSTKAVAEILREKFPNTEIVYTKARLTSEFRQEFELPKSRSYNDLHHAVDAYLNIVTGNVYNMMFSRRRFTLPADNKYSIKIKPLFTKLRQCEDVLFWDGAEMLEKVKRTAKRNQAHYTQYAYCGSGGLFDQMPVRKAAGLVPRKEGLPTEKYGGYNGQRIAFFLPVRYRIKKKSDIIVMPVELLHGEQVLAGAAGAEAYAYDRLARLLGKRVDEISFPFGTRPWKINAMLSLDGFRVCIKGASGKGKCLITQPMMPLSAGEAWKGYIKKIENFVKKNENKNKNKKKDENNAEYIYDADYDVVTKEKNMELYDLLADKAVNSIYRKRVNIPGQSLINGREKFAACGILDQCRMLQNMLLSVFGKMTNGCDLTLIGGKKEAGAPKTLNTNMSNWKKKYADVRIIDQSASGLWEVRSENLLDAL